MAQMAINKPRLHDLAQAIARYAQEKKQFPPGIAKRDMDSDRNGLPYPPERCVSWLVEILPYLGREYATLHDQIDTQQTSWREGDNLNAAGTLVPYFVVHTYPRVYWWTTFPGLDR